MEGVVKKWYVLLHTYRKLFRERPSRCIQLKCTCFAMKDVLCHSVSGPCFIKAYPGPGTASQGVQSSRDGAFLDSC